MEKNLCSHKSRLLIGRTQGLDKLIFELSEDTRKHQAFSNIPALQAVRPTPRPFDRCGESQKLHSPLCHPGRKASHVTESRQSLRLQFGRRKGLTKQHSVFSARNCQIGPEQNSRGQMHSRGAVCPAAKEIRLATVPIVQPMT